MTELFYTACLLFALYLGYQKYLSVYFDSEKFLKVKKELVKYIDDCNALNSHILELKSTYPDAGALNHGESALSDVSVYKYKRPKWDQTKNSRWVHNCSSTVAKNANNQPFKYLCKYFVIPVTENTLEKLEHALNCFAAAEQGKTLMQGKRERVLETARRSVPWLIQMLSSQRVIHELGFEPVDLSDLYLPVYSFSYVSAGGKSSYNCDVKLDLKNLEGFIDYLGGLVQFRKSVKGQRALMTARLREEIKERDNYTCQQCDLSTADEPNLLLEIDHKIPLSRGGLTAVMNLQTLCWRCNRSKGSKILPLV